MGTQTLRTDMHRAHILLDKLRPGSSVTDCFDRRWTLDHVGVYWESHEGDIRSSFELAQLTPINHIKENR